MSCIPPYTPLLYGKTGVCRGKPIVLLLLKTWIVVPIIYVLSKNKKNVKSFLLKIFNFYNLRKICILHGIVFVMMIFCRYFCTLQLIMSPPFRVGRLIVFPRASVGPSVRPSVCLSVRHKSCPLYNLKTVKDFSMKLGTLINHDETMCHAQEP